MPEKRAINIVLAVLGYKFVDDQQPIRFNAPRCPDSSVGRAGD
ncbi:hypothetical protein YpMG051020_2297 [Yersinia pestis biovar Orientalis str. MG05-1020]|uniref:Uncharacterized protein n=1 Tax=Yersinia pestis biovar Orientalis str. IP275 TaxID=373665 RepID=A0AAV3BJU5_YERPE|nr:hypothetical protein YPIP275_3285 [Yersinia pestis biovar Orientalis str. IP275]EDR59358.1 hypothetical protein YpMG051020_2297 [Yersinia pestis biovar Orientalis str. MG05-1020]